MNTYFKTFAILLFQLHGVAIDSSVEACELTAENARLNGVSHRLEVLTQTWAESKNYVI